VGQNRLAREDGRKRGKRRKEEAGEKRGKRIKRVNGKLLDMNLRGGVCEKKEHFTDDVVNLLRY